MFIDTDEDNNNFMNVSARTGKTGQMSDLALVQGLLWIIFREDKFLKNPVKDFDSFVPNGRPNRETTLLISAFQKQVLRRPNPEGYVNRAVNMPKRRYTIHALNYHCAIILSPSYEADFDYMIARMSNFLPLPDELFIIPSQ